MDKIKKKEFNIFEEYIKQNSNDKFAIIAAKQLDEYCRKMWIAAHAIITNTELTLNEAELPGYQDVSQLASLGLIGLPPEKIIDGLGFSDSQAIRKRGLHPPALTPLRVPRPHRPCRQPCRAA